MNRAVEVDLMTVSAAAQEPPLRRGGHADGVWGYAGANPVRNVDPAGTCISDSCFDRQAK